MPRRVISSRFATLGALFCSIATSLSGCSANTQISDRTDVLTNQPATLGPLDEFIVRIFGASNEQLIDLLGREDAERWFNSNERVRREEQIAACMARQGFRYYLATDLETHVFVPAQDGIIQQGTREFAESFGFGISTNPPWELMGGTVRIERIPGAIDQNEKLRREMTESEAAAWEYAYWGDFRTLVLQDDWDWSKESWEQAGCLGEMNIRAIQNSIPNDFTLLGQQIDSFLHLSNVTRESAV